MKPVIALILIFHGIVHVFGLLKAFRPQALPSLNLRIPRRSGAVWGLSGASLIAAGLLLLSGAGAWWMPAAAGILGSQLLVFGSWSASRWGTLPNLVLLLAVLLQLAGLRFRARYETEVAGAFRRIPSAEAPLLAEQDLSRLPEPVRRYIRISGAVGKPRVSCFMVAMHGSLRKSPNAAWMPFRAVQYNFLEPETRCFFLDATMFRLPVAGFHNYRDGKASMDIRLFSLFPVQYQDGPQMDTAETATFFNDMCCMAPGSLVDPRIRWEDVGSNRVRARFTAANITVTATLAFNAAGELVSFRSEDRFETRDDGRMFRSQWITPLQDYRRFGDQYLAARASAVYMHGEVPFCYGRFQIDSVTCNPAASGLR